MSGKSQIGIEQTHQSARLLKKADKAIPSGWLNDMRRCVQMGEELKREEHAHPAYLLEHVPPSTTQRLIACARGGQAVRKAAYAAFYVGIMKGIPRSSARARWGAIVETELAKAFLWLPADNRREFLYGAAILGLDQEDWAWTCTGAVGVARVVRFLLGAGCSVFWPTVEEDVFDKIDLFVRLADSQNWVCLQIKTRRNERSATWSFLKQDSVVAGLDGDYLKRFLSRVEQIQRANPGRWEPVYLQVGTAERPDKDEKCPILDETLTQFVQSLKVTFADSNT